MVYTCLFAIIIVPLQSLLQKVEIMKRSIILVLAGLMTVTAAWSAGIDYNGTKLQENKEFTRTECGTMAKKAMKEVSGLACSRQTPGYLWAQGDEDTGSDRKIVAVKPDGTLVLTVNLTTPGSERDDWEDICTGVFEGTNYLFIGAFGDNDEKFNDDYYIYFFEEPSVTSGSKSVIANYIRFGFPDNTAHNTETLMYDNVEQMFYIADKADGVCHLYSLPFRTDYGTALQRLTEVCALGNGNKFKKANGGDITPDGQWMAIKNESYVLLWERQGSESLSETAKRLPVQVTAYEKEEQGESLAWFDANTFYSTSDSKKDTPIYKYTRNGGSDEPDPVDPDPEPEPEPEPVPGAVLYEIFMTNSYSAYITAEDASTIQAYYLAGEDEPVVDRCTVNKGTVWQQDGTTLTLTGDDETVATWSLAIEAVQPLAFTTEELVLDGSETWIKGAYGFDETKKWKFSKTDEDYSRELAGKTHLELFLPACDTVVLFSMDSKERDVRVYLNGKALGDKFKLLKSGSALVVNEQAPFMLTVASAQSSGDGGIKAVRLAKKTPTGIESPITNDQLPMTHKVIRNGVLYILRDGKKFTIEGQQVR